MRQFQFVLRHAEHAEEVLWLSLASFSVVVAADGMNSTSRQRVHLRASCKELESCVLCVH